MVYDVSEFASAIRDKYNAYHDVDDVDLANAIIEKYPEYAKQVNFGGGMLTPDKRNPISRAFGNFMGSLLNPKPEGADIRDVGRVAKGTRNIVFGGMEAAAPGLEAVVSRTMPAMQAEINQEAQDHPIFSGVVNALGGLKGLSTLGKQIPKVNLVDKFDKLSPILGGALKFGEGAIHDTSTIAAYEGMKFLAKDHPDLQEFVGTLKDSAPLVVGVNAGRLFGVMPNSQLIGLSRELLGRGIKFTVGGSAAAATSLAQGNPIDKVIQDTIMSGGFAALGSPEAEPFRTTYEKLPERPAGYFEKPAEPVVEEKPTLLEPAKPIEQPAVSETKEVFTPEERTSMEQQIAKIAPKEMPVEMVRTELISPRSGVRESVDTPLFTANTVPELEPGQAYRALDFKGGASSYGKGQYTTTDLNYLKNNKANKVIVVDNAMPENPLRVKDKAEFNRFILNKAIEKYGKSATIKDETIVNKIMADAGYDGVIDASGQVVKYERPKDLSSQFQTPEVNVRVGTIGPRDVVELSKEKGKFKAWINKEFRTKGNFNQEIFDRLLARNRFVDQEVQKGAFAVADVQRAIQPLLSRLDKAQKKDFLFEVNKQLQGQETQLPEEIKSVIQPLRDQIDQLTNHLITAGAAKGEMADTLRKNIGAYLHRSYRIYEEPNWRNVIPGETQTAFLDYLKEQNPELSDDEVKGLFDSYLNVETPMFKTPQPGSKNKDILKHRSDLPAELRALWGEYKEFDINAMKSISKMANLVASHQFLREIMEQGAGVYFFKKPTVVDGISYSYPFTGNPYQPIEGVDESLQPSYKGEMYTSKEIHDAFKDYYSSENPAKWLAFYYRMIYLTKFGKVILSPKANIRNFFGNFLMLAFNGNYDLRKASLAFKTGRDIFFKKGTEESRAYILKLIKLGVLEDGVKAADIKGMLADANITSLDKFVGHGLNQGVRKFTEGAAKIYGLEDAFFKIIAFEGEKVKYRAAFPDMPADQLESLVANIVRKTMPTYSELPRAISNLRRFPFVGPFISFRAALLKSSLNTMLLAKQELSDPNVAVRTIGAKRLAGSVIAMSVSSLLELMSILGLGSLFAFYRHQKLDKKRQEAYRVFMPEWAKNSNVFWQKEGGTKDNPSIDYINLGYTDPYQAFKNIYGAIIRGEDSTDKIVGGLREFFKPFTDEDILTGAILDLKRNTTKDGKSIYLDSDLPSEKAEKMLVYLWNKTQPEPAQFVQGIYKSLTDKGENIYGQRKDVKQIVASEFTGFNLSNVRPLVQFKFLTSKFLKDSEEIKFLKTPEERTAASIRVFNDYKKYFDALQDLDIPKGKIISVMQLARVPQEVIAGMLGVDYEKLVTVKEQAAQLKRGVNKNIMKEIITK